MSDSDSDSDSDTEIKKFPKTLNVPSLSVYIKKFPTIFNAPPPPPPPLYVNFSEHGNCDDEITMEFDDDKKLFVSKNFLRYASPVFEAMFSHGFEEEKNNHVKLPGKSYDEFLEFLMCIHPRVQRPVTGYNALRIVNIADEYQVTSVMLKCKNVMKSMLQRSEQQAKSTGRHYFHHATYLRDCLYVFAKAVELNYGDLVDFGVKTIAKFGHVLYNEGHTSRVDYYDDPSAAGKLKDETYGEIKEQCMKLFYTLPAEIRFQILSERLHFWDDPSLK